MECTAQQRDAESKSEWHLEKVYSSTFSVMHIDNITVFIVGQILKDIYRKA